MYYVINKSALYDRILEEVSYVADDAYAEGGGSLYDSVILTEKDKPKVNRLIDDAVSAFVRRAFDICKYAPLVQQEVITPRLVFHVPDFDTTMQDAALEEVSNFIVLYSATQLFQERRPSVVPLYTDKVQAAMDKAITLLKSRKAPNEQWS